PLCNGPRGTERTQVTAEQGGSPTEEACLPRDQLPGEAKRQVVVVDEPSFPQPRRNDRKRSRLPKSSRIDHLRVVDRDQRFGCQSSYRQATTCFWIALAGRVCIRSLATCRDEAG